MNIHHSHGEREEFNIALCRLAVPGLGPACKRVPHNQHLSNAFPLKTVRPWQQEHEKTRHNHIGGQREGVKSKCVAITSQQEQLCKRSYSVQTMLRPLFINIFIIYKLSCRGIFQGMQRAKGVCFIVVRDCRQSKLKLKCHIAEA